MNKTTIVTDNITVRDMVYNVSGGAILNGSTQYYSHPDNANLNFGTGDFSMSIFTNGFSSTEMASANFNTIYKSISTNGLWVALYSNSLYIKIGAYGTTASFTTLGISANTKYKIDLVRSDDNILIYVNSILKTTSTGYTSLSATDATTKYFGYGGSADRYLTTTVYDIGFYNYVLTQAEVTERWNNGKPEEYIEPYATRDVSNTDLSGDVGFDNSGYWTKAGTATVDDAGNSKAILTADGTLNNYFLKTITAVPNYKRVRITYEVTANTLVGSGTFYMMLLSNSVLGNSMSDALPVTVGTHTLELTVAPSGTRTVIGFRTPGTYTSGNLELASMSIIPIGQTFSVTPKDFGTNGAKCIIGGLPSVLDATANPITPRQIVDGRTDVTTTAKVLTNSQRANTTIHRVRIKNSATGTFRLGTTSGGTQLLNDVAVTANTWMTYYVTATNAFVSAVRTLYAQTSTGTATVIIDYED